MSIALTLTFVHAGDMVVCFESSSAVDCGAAFLLKGNIIAGCSFMNHMDKNITVQKIIFGKGIDLLRQL